MVRGVALALVVGGLAGCPRGGGKTTPREPPGKVVGIFRPTAVAAGIYNEFTDPVPPEGELESLLLDVVTQKALEAGKEAPQPDPRLAAAAADLARALPDDQPPGYDVIEFALQHHGIIEPSPHLVVVEMTPGGEDALVEELREKLPAVLREGRYRRFGAGAVEEGGKRRVVIALQESWVETDPIPRALPSGGAAELRARLVFPYKDAHVLVTPPRGKVVDLPLSRAADGGFRAWIRCEADGRYQVEVGGSDKLGAEVLANFPVYCGEKPPSELAVHADAGTVVASSNEAEQRVFELLNADRERHGLAPVVWDARVAAVARAHSQDMLDHDFVGHVSPTTGSASDRLRRARVGTATVLENVARAYSPEEAEHGLMGSPGHRANILSPEATHAGIGVVLGRDVGGRPELLVTQLFIRVPPKLDPAAAVAEARAVIAERRKAKQLKKLSEDAELGKLAAAFARELASGVPREESSARLDAGLDRLGAKFSVVKTNLMVVGAIPQIGGAKNIEDPAVTHLGIGVAQGNDEEIGQSALFVVVLLAESR